METFTANSKDSKHTMIDHSKVEAAVRLMFEGMGEDPERVGLKGTPDRIARMFEEIYRGYNPQQKPKITCFPNSEDGLRTEGLVVDTGDYHSMCEHHMMPFFGKYLFAYIPNKDGRIIGISKIGRVVDYCAAKLQVQERLSQEVLEMITNALNSGLSQDKWIKGAAIIMEGEHLCKTMRGAKKKGLMRTFYATGVLNTAEYRTMLNQMFNER